MFSASGLVGLLCRDHGKTYLDVARQQDLELMARYLLPSEIYA